ncbi:Aste57867_10499 [Aphanomyces stellatus]|uniref:Aste57867_10499 protein n=1 Tax=Aphanomyces stellatus TaxID=120398 RepID=A0A485KR67_9STRA|nr:hypothetical protein As57867_010459 [Aphanomyces stellatus]VFT87372.1 Aste57867_10499 [Aphanomyces stellatus]
MHRVLVAAVVAATPPPSDVESGIGVWVDVDTPAIARQRRSSRGDLWDLVMSDEFNIAGRSFQTGKDHLWTALDIPDGVNDALGMYNSSNVYTKDGKLFNRVDEGPTNATYFNQWLETPAMETRTLHYTAGMMQSWNKFCFQGGRVDMALKLPGAVNPGSWNPHVATSLDPHAVIPDIRFYPTWPGIWLMGNLGRALFAASTTRMWPWSYNECNSDLAPHQWINACNATPGFGLNPNQGRGAPEIDLLEGGGVAISSSIQIAPGMPDAFRRLRPNTGAPEYDAWHCFYAKNCRTPGANMADAPTSAFASRGHASWYQKLRYAANDRCPRNAKESQLYEPVATARQRGITANQYDKLQMSASRDVHADLDWMDGNMGRRWGINGNGTCFAIANGYTGVYLCDPDNRSPKCIAPRRPNATMTHQMPPFEYQMDALSANWDINFEAYTSFYHYSLEWVTGRRGYVRWMLDDMPLFEVPAEALERVPQGGQIHNPPKLMIEEPMYLILNIAVAKAWGATPPNMDIGPCRGNSTHPPPGSAARNLSNNICDSFPMYMEIDYIRIYQDTSTMAVGCDPPTHPTKEWIQGHLSAYTDAKNPDVAVHGGATCRTDADCSRRAMGKSGRCHHGRCRCIATFGGPRCTEYVGGVHERSQPQLVHGLVLTVSCLAAVVLSGAARTRRMRSMAAIATADRVAQRRRVDANYHQHDDDDGDDELEL